MQLALCGVTALRVLRAARQGLVASKVCLVNVRPSLLPTLGKAESGLRLESSRILASVNGPSRQIAHLTWQFPTSASASR